ncbi:MAG: hypothetical protein ABIH34_03985 [Nanoarchaeota archaeon]
MNGVLVGIVFFLVVILIFGSVFFQGQFQKLTNEHKEEQIAHKNATQFLELCQQQYSSAILDLNRTINITQQEKTELRKVYTFTKEGYEGTLINLNTSLVVAEASLELTAGQLAKANAQLLSLQDDLEVTNEQLDSLKGQYDACVSTRIHYKDELDACEASCGG